MLLGFIVLKMLQPHHGVGVRSSTYHHRFKPYSKTRCHCQLPTAVSGRQFRLALHHCPLSLAVFLVESHLAGQVGYVFTAGSYAS